ncbi:unnamed protein product [Ectocarpus sp. 8 AP-2014]
MAPVSYITLVVSALTLLLPRKGADAFVHPRPGLLRSRQQQQSIMVMSATRRAFLSDQLVGAIGAGILGLGLATERATAYEKEYLKEPTAEFKAMESRQADFSAAQRAYKQEFVKKLDAFLAVETDEEAVSTLNAMSNTVIQRGGLPESVRINDLLKTCRRKKAAMKDSGKWSTPVQIAYETLVQTTNRTVIPLQSGS